MKPTIIPSIIAQTQKELNERLRKVFDYSTTVHLDIMDGKFVKNTSLLFDFKIVSGKMYQAHLMMNDPLSWIKKNYQKVDEIIIHGESNEIEESLKLIKKLKKGAGLAINPATFLSRLHFIDLKRVDLLLIMTVEPGKYGSPFLSTMLTKVTQARSVYPKKDILVDGGIDASTIDQARTAGANQFVIGSFLQNSRNVERDYKRLESFLR